MELAAKIAFSMPLQANGERGRARSGPNLNRGLRGKTRRSEKKWRKKASLQGP